jgi:hypothetical protein
MSAINFMRGFAFILISLLASGCMSPEVWKKSGADPVEESKIRKSCYKISEGDGISSNLEVTSKFDKCMRNAGFNKVPQWQQN